MRSSEPSCEEDARQITLHPPLRRFLLPTWDDYRRLGPAGARATLDTTLLILAALVPAYLFARWLKKSGRLGAGVAESPGTR